MEPSRWFVCVGFPNGRMVNAETASEAAGTLAWTVQLYPFSKKGPSASRQSENEAGCHPWPAGDKSEDSFERSHELSAEAEHTEEAFGQAGATESAPATIQDGK